MSKSTMNPALYNLWITWGFHPDIAEELTRVFGVRSECSFIAMADNDIKGRMAHSLILQRQHKARVMQRVHSSRENRVRSSISSSEEMSESAKNPALYNLWIQWDLTQDIAKELTRIFVECSVTGFSAMPDDVIIERMNDSTILKRQHKVLVIRMVNESRNDHLRHISSSAVNRYFV